MERIKELITEVGKRYPKSDFFSDFEMSCQADDQKKKAYSTYNEALTRLDDTSWKILKQKALAHYSNQRPGQTKQGFFNQLNEAFAYQYLVSRGFKNVCFVEERKVKTADIGFTQDGKQRYCEVKTIGISQDEIKRRSICEDTDPQDKTFWSTGAENVCLSAEFLSKLLKDVCYAREQISEMESMNSSLSSEKPTNGLVYIVANFDDFTMDYYKEYLEQLAIFSRENDLADVCFRMGWGGPEVLALNLAKCGRPNS